MSDCSLSANDIQCGEQQGLVPVSRSQVSLCSDEQVMATVRLVGFVLPTLSGDR
jgi:hypothetical protein